MHSVFKRNFNYKNMAFYNQLSVFTDGGARGNPGPASIGAVIKDGEKMLRSYSKFIGNATNNEAEYQALILALQKVKEFKPKQVRCFLDSELLVKQLNHKYKIKEENMALLFIKVWNLTLDFERVEFIHIPREKNKEADKLVNEALGAELSKAKLF